jgi:hypothetical protein
MDYYDLMANDFAKRGYEPYPEREKTKEDLILEKLDMIVNLLNEQNLVNQEIGKFMEATRKISDITEMRISDLENKVNNLEISNNDNEIENRRRDNSLAHLQADQSRLHSRGFLSDTLGIYFHGDGSVKWK